MKESYEKRAYRRLLLILYFYSLLSVSCDKGEKMPYELLVKLGQKEDKIIFIIGKSDAVYNGCRSCEVDPNEERWKALYRMLSGAKDVELIICLPQSSKRSIESLPYDTLEVSKIKEPDNDIFLVFKDNKIVLEFRGVLDMSLLRQIYETVGVESIS